MTGAQIIAAFEQYVDDTTELSSSEELALLNKWYYRVCSWKTWELYKKEKTGSMTTTTTITLPDDFENLVENYNYTDNQYSTEINAKPVVIFITSGNTTSVVQVINWSDRRQYANNAGYCYVDLALGQIVFCGAQPSGATYSYDYKYTPEALTTSTSPTFPTRFHDMLYHGMATDDMIIQLFDKARSYAKENKSAYDSYMADMSSWNSQLLNN